MKRSLITAAIVLGVIIAALGAVFCLLWGSSSSSLAFAECNGSYSLFATSFRCKQPALASLGFWLCGGLALGLAAWCVARVWFAEPSR